jgi:hypothetical protein
MENIETKKKGKEKALQLVSESEGHLSANRRIKIFRV